jgi:hypothetical protein
MVWKTAEGNCLEMYTDGACTKGAMGLRWPLLVTGGSCNVVPANRIELS